jgi:uncharacterized protein (DUF433 family)
MLESVVVRDPEIMSGEPTFRGTRVLVRTLFEYVEAGHSLERFLEGFPTVRREMALQALEEAKEILLASRRAQPSWVARRGKSPGTSCQKRGLNAEPGTRSAIQ